MIMMMMIMIMMMMITMMIMMMMMMTMMTENQQFENETGAWNLKEGKRWYEWEIRIKNEVGKLQGPLIEME